MAWSFVVTDLLGVVQGEIQKATARKVTLPHLRLPTASCTVQLEDPLADTLANTDCLLKCYRIDPTGTKTLAFIGPVVTAEENGSSAGHSLAITAVGPFWRLTKRIIPQSKLAPGAQFGAPGTPVVLGQAAQDILYAVNQDNFTGISNNAQTATTTGWAGPWWNKNAGEAVAELAAGLNTFEFTVLTSEPTSVGGVGGWPQIGMLKTAPTIGQSRPDAVFEYGTTRANVTEYKRIVSRDGLLTNAIISVQGWPNSVPLDSVGLPYTQLQRVGGGTTIFAPSAPTSADITARGLLEEVVDDAGVLDDATRAYMADYQIAVRKQPRELITFQPAPNASPKPLIDYEVGDIVRARAVISGTLRFDALFRIWGISFDIDDNGNEVPSLDLVTP